MLEKHDDADRYTVRVALVYDEPDNRPCDLCDDGYVDVICSNCGGSGEGYADGTTCSVCHGRGEMRDECDNACEYCGEHAALDEDGRCFLCMVFLDVEVDGH